MITSSLQFLECLQQHLHALCGCGSEVGETQMRALFHLSWVNHELRHFMVGVVDKPCCRIDLQRGADDTVDVPDFTRGGWESAKPLGIESVDLEALGLKDVQSSSSQLNV